MCVEKPDSKISLLVYSRIVTAGFKISNFLTYSASSRYRVLISVKFYLKM